VSREAAPSFRRALQTWSPNGVYCATSSSRRLRERGGDLPALRLDNLEEPVTAQVLVPEAFFSARISCPTKTCGVPGGKEGRI
jgi:hypothetical protein